MKKKTIITSLALLAAAAMVGVGTSVGLTAIDTPDQAVAVEKEGDTYLISSKEDLKSLFNNSGACNGYSMRLTADIDMQGDPLPVTSGEFTGEFNGDGHKIYNAQLTGTNSLFNIIGKTGNVHDFSIEGFHEVSGDQTSLLRVVTYQNDGAIANVTAVIKVSKGMFVSGAPFGQAKATGTFTDCETHYIMDGPETNASNSNALLAHDTAATTEQATGCIYTVEAINGATIANNFVKAGEVAVTKATDVSYVYRQDHNVEITTGLDQQIDVVTCGDEYTDLNWTSNSENVQIVSQDKDYVVVNAAAETAATLTGTYTTNSGTESIELFVNAVKSAAVEGAEINSENASLEEGETLDITATVDGNDYDHVEWVSSNPDSVEIDGEGLDATIKALAPSEKPVTITFNVYGEDGEILASDSIDITVTEIVEYKVNVFIPTTLNDKQANNGVLPVGNFTTDKGNTAYTPDNANRSIFSINAGTKGVTQINGEDCYILRFNLLERTIKAASAQFITMSFAYTEGASSGLDILDAVYSNGEYRDASVYWDVATDQLQLLQATEANGNEYNKAADFLFDVIAPNLRQNGDMCYLIEEGGEENLNKVLAGYTNLDSESMAIVDGTKDPNPSMPDDQNTLGSTMAYLLARSVAQDDGSYVAQAKLNNQALEMNAQTIIALALVGGISISALVYMALRKKSKKSE